jgi:hypothetical protein
MKTKVVVSKVETRKQLMGEDRHLESIGFVYFVIEGKRETRLSTIPGSEESITIMMPEDVGELVVRFDEVTELDNYHPGQHFVLELTPIE